MKLTIHVLPKVLADNFRTKQRKPPIVVWKGTERTECFGVTFTGPSRLVYGQNEHSSGSGATVWLEAEECDVQIQKEDGP